MKIAQIICTFPPYRGGMGNSAYHFARLLNKKYDITTFTPQYKKNTLEEKKDCGKIQRIKPILKYGNGAFLPQLFFILKKFDYIYLHYPFFGTAEIVLLFKIFFPKKKLIIHYHMDTPGLSSVARILSIPSKYLSKFLFKKADKIICSSIDYIEHGDIKSFYKKNPDKFIAIPFGVDIKKFHPSKEEKTSKILKLLFVGGLDSAHFFKGVNVLIDSLEKLKNKNWHLNIVGQGNLKEQYMAQAKRLGILEKIDFLDSVSDEELPKKFREADIFVSPSISKNEAFGIVLIEALASGVPVIASNLAGVRTVFKDNIQGLRVKPNDTDDLYLKLEKLIANKEQRLKMSLEARKLAKEKYSWEAIEKELYKVFDNK